MINEFKSALERFRVGLRLRVTRLLIAVLIGTLFVPVGSISTTSLSQSANAATAISTEAQFLAIQNNLSGDYILTASFSISTTSNTSYIAGDFTGTLNGAGFAISGLSKPLFNKIGNGTSSNGVTDLRLITYRAGVTGGGVLANTLESNSQISRVYVSGTLTGSGLAVGGLIGEAKVNSTVTNSYAAVNVTVNSSASTGGLIGVGRGSVTTSAASGNVTQSNSGDNKTGGLVGILYGSVTNCFARGTVTSSAPYSTGGLVGRADGSNGRSYVTKSLAIGNVVIIGGGGYSGGLVGSTYIATIQNSYATGNVTTGTANGKLIGELKENSFVISSYATGTGPSLLIGATAGAANTVTSSPPAGTDLAVLNEVISGSSSAWGISSAINGSTPYILSLETSGFYTNIKCSEGGSFTVITGTKIKSGDGASCKGVVTIPEGITELEGAAFSTGGAMANANPFITEIRFPSTLTNTGDYGLGRLTGLTSLIVPGGAKIGIGSFNGLTSLTELTINGGTLSSPTKTDYTTTAGVNGGKSSGFVPQRLILGNGYTNIRAEAFAGSGFTEVIFGSGTYYVGTASFVTASSLQAIDFGTSTSPSITLATQNVTLAAANPYGFNETGQNSFQGSSIRSVRNCDTNPNSAFNLRLKAITNDLSQTLYSLGTCNNTPPVITNTNPVSASGGSAPTSVTITGTNFVGLVGVRGVMFGSTPAASYTVNSATSITAVPPAAVTSSVYSVTVNTFAGSATTSTGSSDSSLSALTPSVGSLSPAFNKGILSYSANVPKTLNLSLTPTVTQAGATTVQYLGETGTTVFTGALNLGTNVIRTVVTSQDGQSTSVYRVTVPNVRTPEKSICFNGNAQFLSLTTNSNLPLGNSAYTIEAFVKSSVANQGGITEWGNVGNDQQVNGFALGTGVTPNVGYRAYFWGSNLYVNSRNNVLSNGAWHHVVSQWDGTTRRIYEDGYLVSQDTPSAANVTNFSTFVIGRGWNNIYLNGCLSNLRIVKGKAVYSGTSTTTPNFSVPNSTLNPTQSASTNINAITDTQTVLLMANTDDILLDNSSFRYSLTLNGTPTISSEGPFDRSNDATLSSLTLSSGSLSPSFVGTTETYTASVANSVTSITVTPTRTEANATITVNGTSVTSGSASGSISLNVGSNTITVVVTAQDGTTTKSYTVTVTRNSNVATLSALTLSSGSLSPTFASATETYTASVANSVTSITVTPTRTQANATITVNGTSVTSGNASGSISLNVGSNPITVVVTAQDGTTKTYTVTVTRAASTDATLSSLALSSGTLSPSFASATESYTASVANSVTSITVTPVRTQANATITVNGTSVTSGAASGSISLNVGSNTITVVVTAQDGATTKSYTVSVTRLSNDATLSALALSSGTLSPSFASGTTSYTASVANSVTSITVTPTRTQANATITVNGTSVTSGSASGSISLNVGSNTISVVVTAQDGTTTGTYTVTVTRAASTDATLSALALSSGTLSPSFASATESYTASVANSVTSITVTPTRTQANATITVNGTSVTSGSASGAISLNVGSNTITVIVTAQDGTTTGTYTVTVTRLSNDATLSALALSSGTLSPSFASGTTSYTASVANSVTSITVTPTRTQANATITVNGTSVTSGSASSSISLSNGSNTITVVVTAQDGTTTKSYTVTVTRLSNTATISAYSFNSLSPAVTGSVDNSLRTVQLSVPTGTNLTALVATFTLSSGATAAVASTPQISGQTANNFTSSVTYVLTSQDSSTVQNYSVTVIVAGNPSAPQNLTATGGQGSASLSWSAPASDGGRPVTGYVVESSLDSTNWTNVGTTNASTTTLNVSGLANSTTYSFRVRATNISGSTAYNYSDLATTNTYYYVTCSVSGSFYVTSSTIPTFAGRDCKGTATIPQGITGVLIAAFAPGTGSTAGDVNRDLTALVFPASGFAQIDQGGFRNLGLTSLTIPASVTMVGLSAFENNPLTSVTVVGGSGGASTVLSQGAFSNQGFGLPTGTAIALTLGSGKIEISWNFGVKTTFSTVDFGTGLKSIDETAFKSNGIAPGWIPFFPSTITSIANEAFRYSPNLTTIRFGSATTTSITSIARYAFDENYLKSVQYCGPQGNDNALSRYLRDYQKNAKIWCDFVTPNAPTISSTSKTNQQVTIGWTKGADRNEPLTDTYTVQYKPGSGNWISVPRESITALSATIGNLINGTTYTFRVASNNIAGASSYSSEVQVTPLGLARMPLADTSTATSSGYTFNVTNYDASYAWSASISNGSGTVTLGTPTGSNLPVTVSGMSAGATSSVQLTSTRSTYETGTAYTSGTSLSAALTPTFGTPTLRTNGYTVAITNFDSNYTWSVASSVGSATISNGSIIVSGANFSTSVSETVTATRSGYVNGSSVFTATTLAGLTATYNGNGNTGGAVPSDTATYQTEGTVVLLGNSGSLQKPGYTFSGWNLNSGNTGQLYQPGNSYTLANAGVNFYAKWVATPYHVIYNLTEASAGTVPTDSANYTIGTSANIRGNSGSLQRTGYVFAGWTDNANRTGRIYVSGDTYTVQTNDLYFYAAWTPNTYAITFNANGATGTPSKTSDSYTVDSATVQVATIGTMAKTGYNFGGWGKQSVGDLVTDTFTVTSNTTLYAQWNIASFTRTYNLDGGTGSVPVPTAINYLQQFNLAPSTGFTKTVGSDSYAFVSWSGPSGTYNPGQSYTMPAADLTFTATWTRIYNVKYSFSGGSVTNAIADQQKVVNETITVTSTVPTRTGYDFIGWVDQSGESTTAGSLYTVRDDHYLFYAQWSAIPYTVTFDGAGGSPIPTQSPKTIGQSFSVGAAPTKVGYDFKGWSDGTNTYAPGAPYVTQARNIIFTAQWQAQTYVVTYDLNGGSGSAGGNYSYTYGTSAYLLPTTGFSLTDYNFGGWATSPTGPSVGTTFAPSSNITLYAIWNIAIYRLSFDAQGGNSDSATAKVTIGQALILPSATRSGYTLQGWSTQQSGGSITAGGASFTPASDGTLYAQWALQVFTVTYNGNGGTSDTPTATMTNGSITPLILPSASRSNYVFSGWYSSAVGGYLIGLAGGNYLPISTVTIYAHWIQASLEGLGEATKIAEVTVHTGYDNSFSAGSNGSSATVNYTADSLPDGTVITAYVQSSTVRASSLIDSNFSYILSMVVAWVAPDGTVPNTADGKPIVMTITNDGIKKGSRVYSLVGTTSKLLGVATQDKSVQVSLTQDPTVTVAITRPDSPTAVTALVTDESSITVSWSAPEVTGGSAITGYTATSSAGQTCSVTTTSCVITRLAASTDYTFTVVARNEKGASDQSAPSASVTTAASQQQNSGGGSSGGGSSGGGSSGGGSSGGGSSGGGSSGGGTVSVAQTPTPATGATPAPANNSAELQAAQAAAAAELQAAREKAEADAKAASDAAALAKATSDAKAAAEAKALADAALAAELAAKKITPDVTLYSISPKLTLSAFDLAYLKKYLSTLKKTATVTCIGYTYTQKLSLAKATVLAKKQATAVCAIVKKTRPTLKTAILIRPAKSAPKAAAGAQWVAISYRVDGYQLKK